MKQLDDYFKLQKEIFDYFGYVEDWVAIPIDDARDYVWTLDAEYDDNGKVIGGEVRFAETLKELENWEAGKYYSNEIYTQRFLPKWVYTTNDYTMICVDTHTDGNKFLQIFDNSKKVDTEDNYVPPDYSQYVTPTMMNLNDSEHKLVATLGNEMGFGRIMQLARECWAEELAKQGFEGGEFQYGPCVALTTECGCSGSCDWCCGSGWLTIHVKKLKDQSERHKIKNYD